MLDLLYWTTRILIVATWVAVAVLAWQRDRKQHGSWLACSLFALVFASVRAWPWNYAVLEVARGLLRSSGVYDDRVGIKALLAVALVVCVVSIAVRVRRFVTGAAFFMCAVGLFLQGGLLLIETLSLDDFVSDWLLQQPVRYFAEGSFSAVALVGAWRRTDPVEDRGR